MPVFRVFMDGWRDLPAEELELHVHIQPDLIFLL